jgi:hypothetical protein
MSGQEQGIPRGGDTKPGEVVWDKGTEEPETGKVTGDEAIKNNEIQEG